MHLRRALAIAAAALLLIGLPMARAQQPPSLRAGLASVSDGDFPNARAVVNLEDSSGGDVRGLTAANFSVTIDGKSAPVVSAELASSRGLPLDVLIVIDVSGSMVGEPVAQARAAAKAFLTGLAPEDRVALLTFADDAQVVQDFTTDRALTTGAIDGLVARGNTALYKATDTAAQKITASAASRRAVIFLSDGAQDGVELTVPRDQALTAAAAAGAPFFTVGEGSLIDREYLQTLAQSTHGRYLEAPDPKDLGALYAGIGQLLRSQFVVTFDASAANPAGSTIKLDLQSGGATATASAPYKPGAGFAPPAITIEGLHDGESVSASRAITVTGGEKLTAQRVVFYVDDVNVFEATSAPYTFTYDPRRFAEGAHTLRVSAQAAGRNSDATVSFSSAAPVAKSGGGLPLIAIASVAAAVLLAVAVIGVLLRLRAMPSDESDNAADRVIPFGKRMPLPVADGPGDQQDVAVPENIGEPMGMLLSRAGADLGSEYPVGGSPVSIGSASRCGVRVNDPGLAGEEARIWIRKGHLMLHRMTKLTAMVVEGTSGGWQILEQGDTFEIGEHRFEFRLLPEPKPAHDSGDVPNVLRDPDLPRQPLTPPSIHGPMPMPEARSSNFSDLMPRD